MIEIFLPLFSHLWPAVVVVFRCSLRCSYGVSCVMSEIRRNIRAVFSAVATKSESQLEAALSLQCCEDYVADLLTTHRICGSTAQKLSQHLTHLRASLPRWAHYAFKDQILTHGRCSTQAAESNNVTVSLTSHLTS